jgi:hypothetical protein
MYLLATIRTISHVVGSKLLVTPGRQHQCAAAVKDAVRQMQDGTVSTWDFNNDADLMQHFRFGDCCGRTAEGLGDMHNAGQAEAECRFTSNAGLASTSAQAPAAAGGTTAGHMGVGGWLQGVNQNLAQYGSALAEYGYEDTQLLAEATDEELLEAFAELSMKKPHQKLLLRSISALRAQSS